MNKEEVLKLAKAERATIYKWTHDGTVSIGMTEESLLAFANSCEKIGMEKAGEMLSDALQSDLEHGVKWLNEKAAKDFYTAYPAVSKIIGEINSI